MTNADSNAVSTIPVDNLNDFVQALVGWHNQQLTRVQHMKEVPEGSTFKIGEDTEIEMTPDFIEVFKLGIEMTLMCLGTLPFAVEYELEGGDNAPVEADSPSAAG